MSMKDEGYIKYVAHWTKTTQLDEEFIDLITCRNELAAQQLIGVYPDGIGFGNISRRIPGTEKFIISGTQTGHIIKAGKQHFSKVNNVILHANTLYCEGPVQASSEAMTHAAIYLADQTVQAVIHVHHLSMWQNLLDKIPATDASIPYGTPEMANAMYTTTQWILEHNKPAIIVTAGHTEGIFVFGKNLEEAYNLLIHWYTDFQ